MREDQKTTFAERQKTAAAAKAAILAKFKPKTAAVDPQFDDRAKIRAAELAGRRVERATAKAAAAQVVAERKAAEQGAADALEAEALQGKRDERKERKTLSKADAKAKRDAKYAARQARR
jgi:hypothetical protein